MINQTQEKPFVTGGHLNPSSAHGSGCACCAPLCNDDHDEDEGHE